MFLRNVGSHKSHMANIPEDGILHNHCRKTLTSYTIECMLTGGKLKRSVGATRRAVQLTRRVRCVVNFCWKRVAQRGSGREHSSP
jgi:hypothetical protein